MLGVRRIISAVWAMFEPIIPAAPTIVSLSFVRNSITETILNWVRSRTRVLLLKRNVNSFFASRIQANCRVVGEMANRGEKVVAFTVTPSGMNSRIRIQPSPPLPSQPPPRIWTLNIIWWTSCPARFCRRGRQRRPRSRPACPCGRRRPYGCSGRVRSVCARFRRRCCPG